MKIYFSAALSDIPPDHQKTYRKIVETLKVMDHRVIADHILGKTAKMLDSQSEEEKLAVERKLIAWKNQADLIVAEVSYPSFGVGQELEYALTRDKPVIALHLKNRKPHLLLAVGGEYLQIAEYTLEDLKRTLSEYIDYAKEYADTRFNFFISSEIDTFLDWVSKKRKIPRAVFLRQLIEEDMRKNQRYLKEIGKKQGS